VCAAWAFCAASGSQSFSDVPGGAWYAEYIETAPFPMGLSSIRRRALGPDDTITREQAMAMLVRAMGLTGLDGPFRKRTK
jgi:hypothetical protein